MLSPEQFHPVFRRMVAELVLPPGAVPPLFAAVHGHLYDGMGARLKALAAAWPPGADWPAGRAWLQHQRELEEDAASAASWPPGTASSEIRQRDLHELLLSRFTWLAHRVYRDAQVREIFSDEHLQRHYPFIEINRNAGATSPCGRGVNELVTAQEGLRLMEQYCPHPACRCTFDPARK